MDGHNPYAETAADYFKAGWFGPLPLPYKDKFPPPAGFNKQTSDYPPIDQINAWCNDGLSNIGLRCAEVNDGLAVIGIDVDHYRKGSKLKTGFDQLQDLIEKLGALPDTWIATSRTDGKSGIRFYLIPAGLKVIGKVDKDIECISKGTRYAVVWPSIHPDGPTYWWYPPGCEPTENEKRAWDGEIPDPNTLPGLPDEWIHFLTNGRTKLDSSELLADNDSRVDEIYDWAAKAFHGDDESEPCQKMRKKLDQHLKKLVETATFHDLLTNAHWNLFLLAYEGHHGWYQAVKEYEEAYFEYVAARGGTTDRGVADVLGEVFRSRVGALRKIKARKSNKNEQIGAAPVLESCYSTKECKEDYRNDSVSPTLCLATVTPKKVEWLWKTWLPLGKLSMFEGESDVGKSTITLSWASVISTGSKWPQTVTADGQTMESQADPADVVLVGIEDSNADTVVPRLIAAGADLRRVHSLNRPVDDSGNPKPFTIPYDIDWLRQAIVSVKAKLVIIDPITACLPEDTKHNVDSSIRRILGYLSDLAEETNSAIVIIRHFNKSAGMSAKNRGGGSVAYTALCRSVLQATELINPTDDGATHAISLAVGNLSKKLKSLTYKLEDNGTGVASVKYCGTSDLTADQLVGADGAKISDARKTAPMRDDAKEALREILADGKPHEMKPTIAKAMELTGCSMATVKNAAKEMKLIKEREYEHGKVKYWTWRLRPLVIPRTES